MPGEAVNEGQRAGGALRYNEEVDVKKLLKPLHGNLGVCSLCKRASGGQFPISGFGLRVLGLRVQV